jgi:hypothetical protein
MDVELCGRDTHGTVLWQLAGNEAHPDWVKLAGMPANEAADAIPYVPVENRPWRITMGLRPLDVTRWLDVDERRPDELALKLRLLASDHTRVVAALPGSEKPGRELLDEVVDHLGRHHPGLIDTLSDGTIVEKSTGAVVDPAGLHPVDAAARLVQEDLCLMTDDGSGWVLAAASVCFPSRWRLQDKIGQDLAGIHRPVAGYDAIDRPIRSFFDRLRAERPMWRLNWTLLDAAELFQPDAEDRRRPLPPDPGRPDETLWFRVERQTLRRLSERAAVTFTIRTYVASLGQLVAAHPEVVPALRTVLPTVPADSLAYKGWTDLVAPVLRWLETRETP